MVSRAVPKQHVQIIVIASEQILFIVMAGLVPAIHDLEGCSKDLK